MRLIFSLIFFLTTLTLISASEGTKNVIKVCVSPNSMPIETIEGSKHIGMAADFLSLIAQRSGLKFEVLPSDSWTQSLKFAKERRCDMLSAAEKNDAMQHYFNFTESYMYFPIVIIAREGVPFVSSLEAIRDKVIGTIASTEYIELLKKRYPNIQIKEISNTHEGLKAVLAGKIEYFLDITADLTHVTRKYGMSGISIVGFTGDNFNYHVAVRNDNPILAEQLKDAVQSITEEDKQNIFNKWIDVNIDKAMDYAFFGKVLFFILLGFFFFYLWNRKLSKEIQKRENAEEKLHELNLSLERRIERQITKMREKDLLLHQQSRLAQAGELLSNIAHQWRQPLSRLTSLFMQAELRVKQGKFDENDFNDLIRKNNKIIEHMSQTIEDFTHFFQIDSHNPVYFDPVEQCREAVEIIDATLESDEITLHRSFAKNITDLYGRPRAFSHVILILLNNAHDVLQEREITDADIWIEMTQDEDHFHITVEDNAGGVSKENIFKIFDPYFSTKHATEGSGIGLYMAATIMRRIFHGSISVSNTNKGAKFFIEIPLKK